MTTIFCTRHDSDTVVTCAKYRCDRPRIFYTRVFWIFIEFRISIEICLVGRAPALYSVIATIFMMTSSNGNIFRATGPLCGAFTGHRWIPLTKANDAGALKFSLICAWTNGGVNNRDAGDLRRHRAHYDVAVMSAFNSISHYVDLSYNGTGCNVIQIFNLILYSVIRFVSYFTCSYKNA